MQQEQKKPWLPPEISLFRVIVIALILMVLISVAVQIAVFVFDQDVSEALFGYFRDFFKKHYWAKGLVLTLVIYVGVAFHNLKKNWRLIYGLFEWCVAYGLAGIAVQGLIKGGSSIAAIFASIYVFVRSWDNIEEGMKRFRSTIESKPPAIAGETKVLAHLTVWIFKFICRGKIPPAEVMDTW